MQHACARKEPVPVEITAPISATQSPGRASCYDFLCRRRRMSTGDERTTHRDALKQAGAEPSGIRRRRRVSAGSSDCMTYHSTPQGMMFPLLPLLLLQLLAGRSGVEYQSECRVSSQCSARRRGGGDVYTSAITSDTLGHPGRAGGPPGAPRPTDRGWMGADERKDVHRALSSVVSEFLSKQPPCTLAGRPGVRFTGNLSPTPTT